MKKSRNILLGTLSLLLHPLLFSTPNEDVFDIFPTWPEGYYLTIDGEKQFLSYSIYGKEKNVGPAVITDIRDEGETRIIGPEIGGNKEDFLFKPKNREFILKKHSIYLYDYENDEISLIIQNVSRDIFLDRTRMRDFIDNELMKEFQPGSPYNSGQSLRD